MTITEKIQNWINKGGFPYEMLVANALSNTGFTISQSIYFRDNETGKFRETDIIAYTYRKIQNTWVLLSFVIECKSTKDKPWIVFTNEHVKNITSNNLPTYHTKNFKAIIDDFENSKYSSDLFFKNDRTFGYSITTAFNSKEEKSFNAVQTVTKACEYLIDQMNAKGGKTLYLYFPCIFIEGQLFDASLNQNNELNVNPIDDAEILINRSFHEHGNSRIFLFRDSDLESHANKLKELSDLFFSRYRYMLNKHLQEEN